MNEPKTLKRWRRPDNYVGASWPDYYVFLGQTRDSDALARANFDAGLAAIGGEQTANDEAETPLVRVVREHHWAVGWVEWIAIHHSATEALARADEIKDNLEDYPVVDDERFSRYESEEADEVWRNCYKPKERLAYIRAHRRTFEFHSCADVLGCVRGHWFAGEPGELLSR